jgi:hypothetical protein
VPRPGTPVIPAGWADRHATTLAGTRTATGSVTRGTPGPGVFNPATGTTTAPATTTIYTGPVRVQQLLTRNNMGSEFGDQQITMAQARIGLPLTVQPAVDDLITITTSPDPQQAGLTYRVLQVAQSSITWQRDVIAEVNRG